MAQNVISSTGDETNVLFSPQNNYTNDKTWSSHLIYSETSIALPWKVTQKFFTNVFL